MCKRSETNALALLSSVVCMPKSTPRLRHPSQSRSIAEEITEQEDIAQTFDEVDRSVLESDTSHSELYVHINSINPEGPYHHQSHSAASRNGDLGALDTTRRYNVTAGNPYAQPYEQRAYSASAQPGPCALPDDLAISTGSLSRSTCTFGSTAQRDDSQKGQGSSGKLSSQSYLENGWEEFLELVQKTHAPAYKDLDKNSQVHTHLCMAARAKCVELCSGKNPSPETLEILTEGLYERMVRVHSQRIARDQMSHWDWASEVRGKMQACIPGEAL